MVTQLTLKEVLEKAIEREIESQDLCSDLSQKMTDKAAKDASQELARQAEVYYRICQWQAYSFFSEIPSLEVESHVYEADKHWHLDQRSNDSGESLPRTNAEHCHGHRNG